MIGRRLQNVCDPSHRCISCGSPSRAQVFAGRRIWLHAGMLQATGSAQIADVLNLLPISWFARIKNEHDFYMRWRMNCNRGLVRITATGSWIPRYIKLRGTRLLGEMPRTSVDFQRFARQQDLIPWRAFMEGKVSTALFRLQESALTHSSSTMTIGSWAKKFTTHLLHITHAQWVLRNVILHDTSVGYRMECRRTALLREIDALLTTDPQSLPEGRRYLLEMDFSSLLEASAEKQSYWLLAVRAAVKAGRRTRQREYRLSRRMHQCSRGQRRRQQPRARVLDDGAAEVWRNIEFSFGLRARATRKRVSSASLIVSLPDNKRRRPD